MCGTCGKPLTTDPRFVQWCPACGWNANPGAKEAAGRGDRFKRRLNREAEERLYRRVTAGRSGGPALAAATYALAGVVHLVTLAVLAGGVLALLATGWILHLVGLVLVAFTWTLRPRLHLPRARRRALRVLGRDEAPALYALCGRIAAELGTAAPHAIVADARYNASYRRNGLRRRVVLTLGLPLWEVLTPAERVALLGHELGHGANGDSRSGLWVGAALTSLEEWYAFFRPSYRHRMQARPARGGGGGVAIVAEMVVMALFAVFAELTLLLYRTLDRLTAVTGRGAEYRADAFGARIGGREAADGLLRALTFGSSAAHVRHRRRFATARTDLPRVDFWEELRTYVASIPATERERRLRAAALDDSAIDATHPPTHLRLAHVATLPATAPAVVLTPSEATALDRELTAARARVAADLA
jgi:Zn-dependent protease with chaperone function